MLELLFLLLPVAAGYGWVMGRNSVRQAQRKSSSILTKHYFKGLNFILSDQPDKAVDTLIKMIDVNTANVETHISMGNFFRHRGELDRAIKIHQNIVSRDTLEGAIKEKALFELGRDYVLAGFLERAESTFLKLLQTDTCFVEAQSQLFGIYQTTKEWQRAIELAEQMMNNHGDSEQLRHRMSHFYCERAQLAIAANSAANATTDLHRAIAVDTSAVRPRLILARLAINCREYDDANTYLAQIPENDIAWLSEAVPLLQEVAELSGSDAWLSAMLDQYYAQCATAYLAKVKLLSEKNNTHSAVEFLLKQLRVSPTMRGFHALLGLNLQELREEQDRVSLTMLHQLVEEQMQQRSKYRCSNCGFSGRKIHWLCPSCKTWGGMKPIKGLDGE